MHVSIYNKSNIYIYTVYIYIYIYIYNGILQNFLVFSKRSIDTLDLTVVIQKNSALRVALKV